MTERSGKGRLFYVNVTDDFRYGGQLKAPEVVLSQEELEAYAADWDAATADVEVVDVDEFGVYVKTREEADEVAARLYSFGYNPRVQ